MKLNIPSKASKAKRREGLWKEQQKWHVVYLWWPTRTNEDTVQWLERVARRRPGFLAPHSQMNKRQLKQIMRQWEYGHITNVLTQPNRDEVQYATANTAQGFQSPGIASPPPLNGIFGHGLLQAPAGGACLPGGLSIPPGSISAQLQNQIGLANVGVAAHGAGHQATP